MKEPIFWKILIIFSIILKVSVCSNHEHYGGYAHRNNWAIRHVQGHNRHNHDGQWGRFIHETGTRESLQETTRNPMSQGVIVKDFKDTGRLEKSIRHHVGHRLLDEEVDQRSIRTDKLSAVAVNEYSGSQALAYATFHDNYRPRENNPPVYLHVATTPSTYTKHHSGYVNEDYFSMFQLFFEKTVNLSTALFKKFTNNAMLFSNHF